MIYSSRYAAQKVHGKDTGVIVKVVADEVVDARGRQRPSMTGYGYKWLSWQDYKVYSLQK